VVRYTFTTRDFHSLLFAGFAGALIMMSIRAWQTWSRFIVLAPGYGKSIRDGRRNLSNQFRRRQSPAFLWARTPVNVDSYGADEYVEHRWPTTGSYQASVGVCNMMEYALLVCLIVVLMISVIGVHRNLANICLKTNPGGFMPAFTSCTEWPR